MMLGLLIHNLPYWLQERAKYLHLWQGRNKLMDQLPVGGRYVPSQARKKYVTEVIFVIPAATEQSMFSLYLWAGLGWAVKSGKSS